ncbi:MAG: Hint domain-containing protein [Aliishimia sp.]
MNTGFSGTFVISWAQTEVDGIPAAPLNSIISGVSWRWQGKALRVDGPQDLLRLQGSQNVNDLRQRAARRVHGTSIPPIELDEEDALLTRGFVVTDGVHSYAIALIDTPRVTLLMFQDTLPPPDRNLWVVRQYLSPQMASTVSEDLICFTQDTLITTQTGSRRIDSLSVGDTILTKDNGPQPVQWIGQQRMSRARLMLMPILRPVRIMAGALGIKTPDTELRVSPKHRLLAHGPVARDLFNTDEVLVPACDLLCRNQIMIDHSLDPVTYVHLMFEHHQVIWANGVETESFHPADMPFSALSETDRKSLQTLIPSVASDPYGYGMTARRTLSQPEAALLQFAA